MSSNETFFSVKLPSKCLVYDGIEAGNSKDQIKIRTFKGRDEKLLAELSTENFEKKFCTVLQGVLEGIHPEKLTIGDRQYLMIWETINSYDKTIDLDFVCDHCNKKFQCVVDLSLLNSIELPDNFKEPFEVKLPESGNLIRLRLLRVEDIIKAEELKKMGQNVWLVRYAMSLVNDKGLWENVEYLEKMAAKDLMQIRSFHEKFNHGVDLQTPYQCQNCGGTGIMPVPFRLDNVLPIGEKIAKYIGDAV